MEELKHYANCVRCKGTGVLATFDEDENAIEIPCTDCGGVKFIEVGKIDGTVQLESILLHLDWLKRKMKKVILFLNIPDEEA